jgi:ABC-type lipoprotein export system ATPase subunit
MQLRASEISHRFPGQQALFEHLSFTLNPGSVTALTGPSGSGKSTLLGILAGSIRAESGIVERDGIETTGWVFQNPHGVVRRTALDHVVLPLLAKHEHRTAAESNAMEILAKFGLEYAAERLFKDLSGGEAQRLMLARAVATAPDLLLVDEPTAQLDVHTAATVSDSLGAIALEGTIVIVATHDPRTRDACRDVIDLAAP